MKAKLFAAGSALALVLAFGAVAYGDDRPHEGKIVQVDQAARKMVIQGEHGDQWDLYWTETTKIEHGKTVQEMREGDEIHFDDVEKDGKKWLTELRRTHKADD